MRQSEKRSDSTIVTLFALFLLGIVSLVSCHPVQGDELVAVTDHDRAILRGVPTSLWQWTPESPHLRSVVRITSGNSGGSGVYVQFGQLRGVLTAAHVFSGDQATVHFSDGTSKTGWATVDKDRHDIGWINVQHDTIPPLPVAEGDASGQIEIAGFGGPRNVMRHFAARVLNADNSTIQADGKVTHGDSGGPWFVGNAVCGIQSTGSDTVARIPDEHGHGWNIYGSCRSARVGPIRRFLSRVHQRLFHQVQFQQPGGT